MQRKLIQILQQSPVWDVLPALAACHLPNWWLAGGAIRNTVWKSLYPEDCRLIIKDFDVAFFDMAGGREQEKAAREELALRFPNYIFDVKNQASFARWRHGTKMYTSVEDGLSHWLHTATSVGIRCSGAGVPEIIAPYGLSDLMNGIVRPTPEHRGSGVAYKKAQGYLAACPSLTYFSS